MKLLADECCDSGLVSFLRKEGHDVLYITEYKPGALDLEVVERAKSEKRIPFSSIIVIMNAFCFSA